MRMRRQPLTRPDSGERASQGSSWARHFWALGACRALSAVLLICCVPMCAARLEPAAGRAHDSHMDVLLILVGLVVGSLALVLQSWRPVLVASILALTCFCVMVFAGIREYVWLIGLSAAALACLPTPRRRRH